jgi:hypothetical protein
MTNREIYDAALALLAEEQYEDCGDYEARAPYLLAAFVNECREVSGFYRAAHGERGSMEEGLVMLDLDGEFPLHNRLSSAAAFYLAALLVEGEDEALSDRLFAHYAESVSHISEQGCSGVSAGIRDVYGLDM